MYSGIQNSIRSNRIRSIFLVILFPIILWLFISIAFTLMFYYNAPEAISFAKARNDAFLYSVDIFSLLGPILLIRGIISFFFYRQIIFKFSGARAITRQENPEIYNIVENLCISKGLPVPKIGVIQDDSLNAFATGRNNKNAWIVFSRGIINKLNRSEIEAVAAHELTHIINKDSLLMIVIVVFVGAVATIGQILMRVRSSGKSKNPLPLIGLILVIVGYLIYPFIQMALSRKREYLADAGSVEITKDKYAMISALEKISQDPVIESIEKDTVAAMCIQSPFLPGSKFKTFLSTHPSIEDRIKALQSY